MTLFLCLKKCCILKMLRSKLNIKAKPLASMVWNIMEKPLCSLQKIPLASPAINVERKRRRLVFLNCKRLEKLAVLRVEGVVNEYDHTNGKSRKKKALGKYL